MKKIVYLCAAAAAMASCGPKNGYTINGTVEGANDGDLVYLQMEQGGRGLANVDSAAVNNGAFAFKGIADTLAVPRRLTYNKGDEEISATFFLEAGDINVKLAANECAVAGTPSNDTYQQIAAKADPLKQQMYSITFDEIFKDSTLTEEERAAKQQEAEDKLKELDHQRLGVLKAGITENISNAVGVYLLKKNYYEFGVEELAPLVQQIVPAYDNDEGVNHIRQIVKALQQTVPGQKFTDFAMQSPDGKEVKLSDYAGKGKVVLVDFWASWCGPCRKEMPNLVKAYAKYKKGKKFEIVGVSLDRNADEWKAALKTLEMTWPQMSDLKFWDCEGAKLYGVSSIPHTVLIDGEGTILARGLHGDELQSKLAELFGK